jgi:hypothetical protein
LTARLSRPAHAFLIAFRPDGKEERRLPEKDDDLPPLTDQPRYPSVERDAEYGLEEGAGLHVFAVVVLRRPVSYREWKAQRGEAPWRHFEARRALILWDDGVMVERLTEIDANGKRAVGKKAADKAPVVRLTDWLRQAPDVETAAALAFTVLPKKQ